ncbi:MAG: hypothetical protein Q9162_003370 [Coniocarpon cinnabarinum]
MKTLSLFLHIFLASFQALAQTASGTSSVANPAPAGSSATTSVPLTTAPTTTSGASSVDGRTDNAPGQGSSSPPDVYLNVPQLSVGRIELDVNNLQADLNLNAQIASLVTLNAGVSVSVSKVNITIADVDAELELIVRLGNLVDIVNRTLSSLDLNPLLISTLNNLTNVVDDVVGEVDGLLGTVTSGGNQMSFLIDNLGNIVQQVTGTAGNAVSTIVGDYLTNMTFTGEQQTLQNGLVQKTYSYSPLNSLVNIIFNSLGQVVQATVRKGGSGSSSSSSAAATGTAPPQMRR